MSRYTAYMPVEIHSHLIDKLAFVNGIVSGFALYPQVFNVLYNHAPADFSVLSLSLVLFNSIIWIAYALHRRLVSLFIASLLNSIAVGLLLTLAW